MSPLLGTATSTLLSTGLIVYYLVPIVTYACPERVLILLYVVSCFSLIPPCNRGQWKGCGMILFIFVSQCLATALVPLEQCSSSKYMLIGKMNQGMQSTKLTWVEFYSVLQCIQCWSRESIWEARGGTSSSLFLNFSIPFVPQNKEA